MAVFSFKLFRTLIGGLRHLFRCIQNFNGDDTTFAIEVQHYNGFFAVTFFDFFIVETDVEDVECWLYLIFTCSNRYIFLMCEAYKSIFCPFQ